MVNESTPSSRQTVVITNKGAERRRRDGIFLPLAGGVKLRISDRGPRTNGIYDRGLIEDRGRKDFRLREEPDKYYITPHYERYPVVLARLDRLSDEELRDLLLVGYNFERAKRKRVSHAK